MKLLPNLIRSLWFVTLLVLFGLGLATSTPGMAVSAIAYDDQTQPTVSYDAPSLPAVDYDAAPTDVANETRSGRTGNRVLLARFAGFVAAERTAFRAINPAYAESTAQSGFFRSGAAGRLGNDGIYANSTVEGAIAEFQFHNPAVFRVQYPSSPTLNISPPSGYFNQPLPFTQGANILTAPSLRAPSTVNMLIREGAVPAGRIQ